MTARERVTTTGGAVYLLAVYGIAVSGNQVVQMILVHTIGVLAVLGIAAVVCDVYGSKRVTGTPSWVRDLKSGTSAFVEPSALYEADGVMYVAGCASCGPKTELRSVEVTRLTESLVQVNVDDPLPPLRAYDTADGFGYPIAGDLRVEDIVASWTNTEV